MLTVLFAIASAAPPAGVSVALQDAAADLEQALGPGHWMRPAPPPIVNGTVVPVAPNRVVALALVDGSSGDAFAFCSGSLIASQWVLTAAHCLFDLSGYTSQGLDAHVVWGKSVGGYSDAIPWASSVKSPAYAKQLYVNDVGLVELEWPKEDVQWMVLNDAPVDASWVDTDLTFYGYGIPESGSYNAGLLRSVVIPLSNVDEHNVYTFHPTRNVCSGDSGGPSTYEGPDGPHQVGINAFVTELPCEGSGSGSSRVDPHVDWIREHAPEVATSFADLPFLEPEPVAPAEPEDRGDDWVDEVFYRQEESGCATVCGTPRWGETVAPLSAWARRR